ncbi:MAG: hypothetical protein ACRC68_14745 [Clostridium sp.]
MVNIVSGNEITKFNQNALDELKKGNIKVFKSRLRNNSRFMDMEGLVPAILKKAVDKSEKYIIDEIENIIEEFMIGVGL